MKGPYELELGQFLLLPSMVPGDKPTAPFLLHPPHHVLILQTQFFLSVRKK